MGSGQQEDALKQPLGGVTGAGEQPDHRQLPSQPPASEEGESGAAGKGYKCAMNGKGKDCDASLHTCLSP